MNNKKHIDRLFQEKFKDFEVKPDPKIWRNIQNEIAPSKNNKKRIIPIWFKYAAGVAALLLLLLTVGINSFNPFSNTNSVVDKAIPIDKTTQESSPSKVVSTTNSSDLNTNNDTEENSNENEIKTITETPSDIVSASSSLSNSEKKRANNRSHITKNNTSATSIASFSKKLNTASTNKVDNKTTLAEAKNSNAQTNPSNSVDSRVAVISNSNVQKTTNREEDINNAINAVKEDTFSSNGVAQASNKTPAKSKILKDSIIPTNALENAVIAKANSRSEEIKEEESTNKWSVNANVSPVYYNTMGSGSHIDEQFVNNDKTGRVNMSYGVNVGYAINDRLKVRSGINSLNLGYDTNNVVVYESVANSGAGPNSLENLKIASLNTSGVDIAVISGEKINTNQLESFFTEENFKTTSLTQQINYIEIPVELEYSIINKRLGVNVVGGMSTFILGENEVSTELKGTTTQIGEVNNINNISFSTNIGLGVDYGVSKAVKINLEPTFKYQLNAFNDTAGNFNPFILGVYTGVSYKF